MLLLPGPGMGRRRARGACRHHLLLLGKKVVDDGRGPRLRGHGERGRLRRHRRRHLLLLLVLVLVLVLLVLVLLVLPLLPAVFDVCVCAGLWLRAVPFEGACGGAVELKNLGARECTGVRVIHVHPPLLRLTAERMRGGCA